MQRALISAFAFNALAIGAVLIGQNLFVPTRAAAKQKEPVVEPPRTMLLWPGGAPGALGSSDEDKPSLTYYPPWGDNPSRTGVIVAPGGGYEFLASNHEGRQVANWFNALGLAAFVLKYRLGPRYHYPIEFEDAQRAIRLVRANAKEFHLAPDRIGMMGFSAGGHLASTLATHSEGPNPNAADPIDRENDRPDFLILGYPVITMEPPYAHEGSVHMLLGEHPDPKLRELLSNERHVTSQTPPTFLFSTSEDKTVPAENSLEFYEALRKAGVPAELHIFQNGPHGVGLDLSDPALGAWPKLLEDWLRVRGLLSPPH
jgi:acetyl esterase/lipase